MHPRHAISFAIYFLILGTGYVTSLWRDSRLTKNQLKEGRAGALNLFEKGLKPHTMKIGFEIKASGQNDIDIFRLASGSNTLSLKYFRDEKKLVFYMKVDQHDKTSLWELQYPNIDLNDGGWHFLVYRLGRQNLKVWIDCELRKSANSELKTYMHIKDEIYAVFGKNMTLAYGNDDDISYNQNIEFVAQPDVTTAFSERSTCSYEFNLTQSVRVPKSDAHDCFYPLEYYSDVLKKYNIPGVYYELETSTMRDVSEHFENGIDKDHTFEMTYRIKEFPKSNYSYYLISLFSASQSKISLVLDGKQNLLKIHTTMSHDGHSSYFSTDYWADEIYNNNWHTIKYTLSKGIFTLWIDDEMMEDFVGFKNVDLKQQDYDHQFTWFDTGLLILEPRSGLHREPILDIRHLKFCGDAVTTSNSEISLVPDDDSKDEQGYFNSFFRTLGRSLSY